MTPEKEAQLLAETAALKQRVAELEAEQQQREVELAHWLAAEREHWALADALNQTGAAISSTLRGEEVLDRVLDELTRVVACDAACVLLIQDDIARVYRWRGYVQTERASPKEIVSTAFPIDRMSVLKTVRDTGRPVAVAQPAEQDAWVHKFGRVWVKSYACAPIRRRGKVVGFLTIDSETTNYIEPADADALQAFADQAALALENVGLHNQVREEIIRRVRTLKKERNFISTLLDTADALVVALDREGRIVHFNRACEQSSGYSLAEIKNRHVWELLPPDAARAVQRYFTNSPLKPSGDTAGRLQSKFETYLIPKTGPQRLIAWSNASLLDKTSAVEYVIATGIDITEQRQAEAALRESEERFKILFEFAPDAYYLNDLEGHLIDCNRAAEEMTGYQKDMFIGQSLFELNLLSDQDLPKALASLAKGARGEPTGPDEFALIRKDGSRVMVEIRSFPVEIKDQSVILGIARDITEHKQIEEALRQQNEQLQARNQELDAYARTVAHDLKNPIGTLTTMAQVLAEAYATMPPEELGEYLQSMARSSQKANRIVEGLLLLAGVRQRTVAIRPLNMTNIVTETLASMADMIEAYQAEIITPSEWPIVLGYAPWLEEVWSNYISNGLKYGGQPPRLELGTEVQADGLARFWVKDNGPGLTAEAQAQLFTEFTQLEPGRVDSYGLGLSIVRRIIEKLGGQVGVASEGQGSTFSFSLPLA